MQNADIVILSMDNIYSTIGENMRYFMYKYKFSTNDWYRPLSFPNNRIDTYVNNTVNFDIVCTATVIKELCQARNMELTIMIDTLYKQEYFHIMLGFFFALFLFFYIPVMSRLLYAKPTEHFICLCTYSI